MRADESNSTSSHADLVVDGDVIGEGVWWLRRQVERAVARGSSRLVIDVRNVGCFEPAAYEFLLETTQRLRDAGGWLKLLSRGARPHLLDVDVVDLEAQLLCAGG